jgi:hypothetical protein
MGCGLNCYVKDGKLVRVEGMKEAANSRGKLCSRAFASMQWLYSPQRRNYSEYLHRFLIALFSLVPLLYCADFKGKRDV